MLRLTVSVSSARAGKAGKLLHKLGKHIAATMKEHNPNHPNHYPALGHSSSTLSSSAGSSGHGHADGHGLDDAESVRPRPNAAAVFTFHTLLQHPAQRAVTVPPAIMPSH